MSLKYCQKHHYSNSDFKRSHTPNNPQTTNTEVEIAPTSPAALRRTAELFETFSSRRPSRRVIAVLGNITRATPSGVTRFPAGHRLSLKSTNNSIKEEEEKDLVIHIQINVS